VPYPNGQLIGSHSKTSDNFGSDFKAPTKEATSLGVRVRLKKFTSMLIGATVQISTLGI